jgi:2-aminoethylphosphonate-pyruvate transaminase
MIDTSETISSLVTRRNAEKFLFTAGPASLLPENLTGLRPCFGRDDNDYESIENIVLTELKNMSGHKQIARLQGSASLALEIAILNFVAGKVLIVSTGYYSDRLVSFAESAQRQTGRIVEIATANWENIDEVETSHDWVIACYTETSIGLRLPINRLTELAKRTNSRLMLDATASIGLESGHEHAEVIAYSSCKGLFGLTGAAFIAFNDPPLYQPDSFYLNLNNHLEKRMTGPYHAIASLSDVLPKHSEIRESVVQNKLAFTSLMSNHLTRPNELQPLLCTQVNCHITSDDQRVVLYKPRGNHHGSVVCHLGEAHLGSKARGEILNTINGNTP